MKIKNKIWSVEPRYLQNIIEMEVNSETIKIMEATKKATSFRNVSGDIAILPLKGLLDNQTSIETMLFGTSYKEFAQWFDAAIADPKVGAIIISVDSGGGSAIGNGELSEKIYKARGKKPIITVVEDIMASAAYYIGSASDEIVMLPSGYAGSIGTYTYHVDYSKALDTAGIKYTFIQGGENKTENNPTQPLSDSAKEFIQSQINEHYEKFVTDVARNRNTTPLKVKTAYGQGRVFNSRQALEVGMVDRVGTLEEVISLLQGKKNNTTIIKEEIQNKNIKLNKAKLEVEEMR